MKDFASSYGFNHVTSSPHYPQSNGLAEWTVKTVKGLLEQSTDQHLALLTYRATPFPWCGLSPAELLMGKTNSLSYNRMRTMIVATVCAYCHHCSKTHQSGRLLVESSQPLLLHVLHCGYLYWSCSQKSPAHCSQPSEHRARQYAHGNCS